MGGISVPSLLIILLIVLLLFGTKRLRSIGSDLGSALRGFRKGLNEAEDADDQLRADPPQHSELPSEEREETRRD